MSEQAKHLYSNTIDIYVATSVEEAFKLWQDRNRPDGDDDELIGNWWQEPDGWPSHINMQLGQDGKPLDFVLPDSAVLEEGDKGYAVYSSKNREWAQVNPIGFLCSTEY